MTAVLILALVLGLVTWLWNSRDPAELSGFLLAGLAWLVVLGVFVVLASAAGWALE
jgi:hypothetical protein